jgi:predicted small lipoprotein YifL
MAYRIKTRAIGFALLAVFILSACGQKGILYLPEEPVTNSTTPASEVSTESTEPGKD